MSPGDSCELSPAFLELFRETLWPTVLALTEIQVRALASRHIPTGALNSASAHVSQGAAHVRGEGHTAVACFLAITTGGGGGLYF